MSKMRISVGIVGIVGLPAKYGGFETLADNLVRNLGANFEFQVICSSTAYQNKNPKYLNAKLKYVPLKANGISSIFFDIIGIIWLCLKRTDIILVLGVSGALIFPFIKVFSNSKIVTNIDGLEWKREKWSNLAKKYLKFSEAMAVRYSDAVIADNQAIVDYVRQVYDESSIQIAYGGDIKLLTDEVKSLPDQVRDASSYYLGLCRIEPENNVHLILEAFKLISTQNLLFIGNWHASDYGKKLFEKFDGEPNIILMDPIYDSSLLHSIRSNCIGYVHGHSAGGTNPSLVEMMHYNSQIIAFDCSYNRHTLHNKGYYFSDCGDLALLVNEASALKGFMKTDNQTDIQHLASLEYTWTSVSKKYSKVFKDLMS